MRKNSMKAMFGIAVMIGLGLGMTSCSTSDNAVVIPETPDVPGGEGVPGGGGDVVAPDNTFVYDMGTGQNKVSLRFTVSSESTNEVTLAGYEVIPENCSLVIPSTIKRGEQEYTVTAIGFNAFAYCYNLIKVGFAEDSQLKTIVDAAFSSCSNLETVTIPDSLKTISPAAFFDCAKLSNVDISLHATLETIGQRAFGNCTSLETITLPTSMLTIGNWAFMGCSSLKKVTLYGDPTIGLMAFPEGAEVIHATNLATLKADYVAHDGEILTGTLDGETQPYKISIADGATVTLSDAHIIGSSQLLSAGLTCEGDATIILAEGTTNSVQKVCENYPGIQPAKDKTLTIRGNGELTTKGGQYGAGIGSGNGGFCGNIVIEGGTITATGGYNGAGIGSGYGGKNGSICGNIVIEGGNITAKGGSYSAGIGNGAGEKMSSNCGNITITGGTVTATGGYWGGAGIGNGIFSTCLDITVTGGNVLAEGKGDAAGIGCCKSINGKMNMCKNIVIKYGKGFESVTAIKNGDTFVKPIGVASQNPLENIISGNIKFDTKIIVLKNKEGQYIYNPKSGDYGNLTLDISSSGEKETWKLTPRQ